jgi:hypothetical protein
MRFSFPRFREWNAVFTRIREDVSILFLGFFNHESAFARGYCGTNGHQLTRIDWISSCYSRSYSIVKAM